MVLLGVSGIVLLVPVLLAQAIFTGWAALGFYGGSWQTAALAVFSSLLAYAIYVALTLATFVLAFAYEVYAALQAAKQAA
jgi:uncharacterized membrane protein YjjP (DUF1212 family)